MLTIKDLTTETTLDETGLRKISGGTTLLDANMKTRYVSAQRKVASTNDYGKWNVFVEGLKLFGLPG